MNILGEELSFNKNTNNDIELAKMAVENGIFDNIEDAYSVFKYVGYEILTRFEINDYKHKVLSINNTDMNTKVYNQ